MNSYVGHLYTKVFKPVMFLRCLHTAA